MKKLLIVVLLAVISTATFATTGEGNVKVTKDSSAVFKVYYNKPVKAKVFIQIFNEKNEKVFSEVISKGSKGFVRPYNLSELPKGVYTFQVADGDDVSSFEFDFKENKSKESNTTAIVNKIDTERVFLALSNNVKKSNVSIKIYAGTKEVYNVNEVVDGQFAQIFNLKDVKLNTVTFKVFEGTQLIKEASF